MASLSSGDQLPEIIVPPPGPQSRSLAAELQKYESPNVTFVSEDLPIFWSEALGANVLDVDGNRYIDLTAGFGVASTGHRNPAVTEMLRQQLGRLQHGLGDVHPPRIKVKLLKRLAAIAPGELGVTILANTGAEAVEIAIKTARLASGRPGVVRFTGGYHGLTYGALAVTDRDLFRSAFADQLGIPTLRAPFPDPYRPPDPLVGSDDVGRAALDQLSELLETADGVRVGAVIVEPILGRGGVVIPPDGFAAGLRKLCDRHDLVLIFDEVITGLGRTGRWFACEHESVTPDLLCMGKSLTGSLPFSACIGVPDVMRAWPPSGGEAIHTSTFLGHPLGCAAAISQIEQLRTGRYPERAARLGLLVLERLGALLGSHGVGDVRGRGLLVGVDIVSDYEKRTPDPDRAHRIVVAALQAGVLLTAGGTRGNVLTLTPPLTITEDQLGFACDALEDCLARG